MSAPSADVLRGFGLDGASPAPLPGGEGTSFLAGELVLKPTADVELARWCQELAARCSSTRAVLPAPVAGRAGDWVVDGWTATTYVTGLRPLVDEPRLVIETGLHLASAVAAAGIADTGPVRLRTDRWARADRFVWGEEELALEAEPAAIAEALRHRCGPADGDPTVIHGDLSGNVFADPAGRSVVLDLTPYVRPVRYGSAIVVADHLLWNDGDVALVDLLDGDEDGLARALLFRLVSEQLGSVPRHGGLLGPHRRVLDALGW
ncbi:MAG: phosphotransferase [Actinomycetota bacterium]